MSDCPLRDVVVVRGSWFVVDHKSHVVARGSTTTSGLQR